MSTKIEPATTAAASNPKISMFATKTGFVIPKNKLSGSLVPIFRGNKKLGGGNSEEKNSKQQVQRRTKWGPDLTQDPSVRKGRALAYQTRVNQITQHLKLGSLEIWDHQDSPLESSHLSDRDSSVVQFNSEDLKLLEVERREAIGEILKLNPTYKAPADYKPLLKEAKVPIPIKEYPAYNFIGLIFGSASDTQKRLEKETGAKIRVYGTKESTGEKNEITPDGNETLSVYKELYVHVCADTYEKVDAAVALIELLVTPVSVTPVSASTTSTVTSGDSMNVIIINPSQGSAPTALNHGALSQTIPGRPPPPHSQFNPPPWYPMGGPPPSGFTTNQNPSLPILNNPSLLSSSNMSSIFGPRPQNPNFLQSRPPHQPMLQGQRPYMPPPLNFMGPPRNPTASQSQPNVSGQSPSFTGAPPHNMRPLGAPPVVPLSAPPLAFLNRPPLISTGWSQPSNTGPPPASSNAGPHPMSAGPRLHNMNSPFRPPPTYPTQAPHSSMSSSMQPLVPRPNTMFGSAQIPSSLTSAPRPPPPQLGNPNYVSEIKPPSVSAPVPLHPSSNNFTFQPRQPQNPVSPALPRPPPPQNFPPPAPQNPSFRPAMHSSAPPPGLQGFPRPQISTNIPHGGPPRHLGFQNQGPVPPQMGPRNFGPGPFQARPGNPMPLLQQNYHAAAGRRPPSFIVGPNQQQQIYDPFSPTSVPQVGGSNPAKVGKQESDPEYEDLMASVGVK